MSRLTLRTLAAVFFRIGNTTFGGGDPTITALQRELVYQRRAITEEEYAVVYALARVSPGTNMLAFCAGAGWLLCGWAGAVTAVAAVTVPSAVLAILLLKSFEVLMQHPVSAAAIQAMVAAAVGLMFAGAWLLARPHFTRHRWVRAAGIIAAAFLLAAFLSPVQVLALAAVVGYFWREPASA